MSTSPPPPDPKPTAPPAATLPAADVPADLAALSQYASYKEIGRGGMGVVYLARNTTLDRLEVLKVMNTAGLDRPGALERFLREMRSAARLGHPNVVHAYACIQTGHHIVFAMEYVDGEDLAKLVRAGGKLHVPHACYYAHQAARGLQHAHERGMVHRDIKPSNLMLQKSGKKHTVKILDFGLAKASVEGEAGSDLTGVGKMLGTPDFVAPEQTRDATNADIRADLYSLGCTLYFLLTGQPPFRGRSMYEVLEAHQFHDAQPLNLVRPEVPAELSAVVAKMMAKDPARRYQTPAEVMVALSPFIRPGAAAPSDPNTDMRPPSEAGPPPPRGGADTVPPQAGSTNPDPAVVPRPVASKVLPVAVLVRPPAAPPPDPAQSAFETTTTAPPALRPARLASFYAAWGLWVYGQVTAFLAAATAVALLTPGDATAGAGPRFAVATVLALGLVAVFASLARDPADKYRLRWRDWRTWAGPLLSAAAYGAAAADFLVARADVQIWLTALALLVAVGLGAVLPVLPKLLPARPANP